MNQLTDAYIGWHYCSLSAFKSIVESKSFHLGNAFFMNDRNEMKEFLSNALRLLEEQSEQAMYARDTTDSDIATSDTSDETQTSQTVTQFARRVADNLRQEVPLDHVYVGCFSTKADDLSQWRGYADDARGVAMKCNLARVEQANDHLELLEVFGVEYDEAKQVDHAEQIIQEQSEKLLAKLTNSSSLRNLAALMAFRLSLAAPRFKSSAFQSEGEIRLLVRPPTVTTPSSDFLDPVHLHELESAGLRVSFKERDGKLVPYIEITFPSNAIEEVMLGPRFGDTADKLVLRLFLERYHVQAKVTRSRAPYR